jgi:hypothetical protein
MLRAVSVLLTLFAASCGPTKTACNVDPFFCSDTSTWETNATRLPTRKLMELHAIDWRYNRPATGIFARILGTKGDASLGELAAFLQSHPEMRGQDTFYEPIISEVSFSSHLDVCHSRFRQQLVELTRDKLRLQCELNR